MTIDLILYRENLIDSCPILAGLLSRGKREIANERMPSLRLLLQLYKAMMRINKSKSHDFNERRRSDTII